MPEVRHLKPILHVDKQSLQLVDLRFHALDLSSWGIGAGAVALQLQDRRKYLTMSLHRSPSSLG